MQSSANSHLKLKQSCLTESSLIALLIFFLQRFFLECALKWLPQASLPAQHSSWLPWSCLFYVSPAFVSRWCSVWSEMYWGKQSPTESTVWPFCCTSSSHLFSFQSKFTQTRQLQQALLFIFAELFFVGVYLLCTVLYLLWIPFPLDLGDYFAASEPSQ